MLLCVAIPDYPLAVAMGHRAEPDDLPVIITDRYDRGRVIALDDRAREGGARVGQTVTQAVAAVPHARVAVYDAIRGARLWEELLDALDAVSPLIEDRRAGTAFLDMRGIAGDPRTWIEQTRAVLAPYEMPLRLGVGPNAFVAYAASWIADGTIIEPQQSEETIASLPLDVLEIERDRIERLHLLGVHTLGELKALPHGPFVRRFGSDAARWHERARGIDRTVFLPRGHAVTIEAAVFGEGRADDEAQVFFALRVLLARIASDLQRCGKRAGALQLELEFEDAATTTIDVLLASPTAQERSMLDVLRAKLEGMTFAAPITGLRVRALHLEEGGEELALFAADDIDPQRIAVTLARLEAALGEPALRAQTHDAHLLEERFCYEPFTLPKREPALAQVTPAVSQLMPQLRLLAVREIEVRVHQGEPASVDRRSILECAGPWRIEDGWFSTPVVRDEYDVVLEDGEIYRIYRQGERWYLRGAYD